MTAKKWILVGVVGILIISVVLAAGCTSTSSNSNIQPSTPITVDTRILGTWTATEWDDRYLDTKTLTINQDGTGTYLKEKVEEKKQKSFTWNEISNRRYIFTFSDGETDTFTLVNNTLVHDNTIFTRGTNGNNEDNNPQTDTSQTPTSTISIAGTWKSTELDDGYLETKTLTINQDGTGTYLKEKEGEKKQKTFTWIEISNGRYLFTFSDGDTDTYVYSNGILSHDNDMFTKEK